MSSERDGGRKRLHCVSLDAHVAVVVIRGRTAVLVRVTRARVIAFRHVNCVGWRVIGAPAFLILHDGPLVGSLGGVAVIVARAERAPDVCYCDGS